MRYFEIERDNTGISKRVYRFIFFEDYMRVVLDTMYTLERATKRHKWKVPAHTKTLQYKRLNRARQDEPEPEIPEDVKDDVIAFFRNAIHYSKWDRP